MKFRLSTLCVLVALIGACLALGNHLFSQPDWLLSMRGKTEAQANAIRGKVGTGWEFVSSPSVLVKQRRLGAIEKVARPYNKVMHLRPACACILNGRSTVGSVINYFIRLIFTTRIR